MLAIVGLLPSLMMPRAQEDSGEYRKQVLQRQEEPSSRNMEPIIRVRAGVRKQWLRSF